MDAGGGARSQAVGRGSLGEGCAEAGTGRETAEGFVAVGYRAQGW